MVLKTLLRPSHSQIISVPKYFYRPSATGRAPRGDVGCSSLWLVQGEPQPCRRWDTDLCWSPPPNSHPAAGTSKAPAVPEGQGDGQTSQVSPGAFQQSRLLQKDRRCFPFSESNFAGAQESRELLVPPAAPREAAHQHEQEASVEKLKHRFRKVRPWGDVQAST